MTGLVASFDAVNGAVNEAAGTAGAGANVGQTPVILCHVALTLPSSLPVALPPPRAVTNAAVIDADNDDDDDDGGDDDDDDDDGGFGRRGGVGVGGTWSVERVGTELRGIVHSCIKGAELHSPTLYDYVDRNRKDCVTCSQYSPLTSK